MMDDDEILNDLGFIQYEALLMAGQTYTTAIVIHALNEAHAGELVDEAFIDAQILLIRPFDPNATTTIEQAYALAIAGAS